MTTTAASIEAEAVSTQQHGDSPARSPGLRVFLAEDDDELRRLLASALGRDGHLVFEARDGVALASDIGCALRGGPAAAAGMVVISDVRMPERDGLSVLRGMSYQRGGPPFIMVTAFGDERLHAEALRLGALAVLDKPFDVDELRLLVRSLGERRTGTG